jgi:hypothetical protein
VSYTSWDYMKPHANCSWTIVALPFKRVRVSGYSFIHVALCSHPSRTGVPRCEAVRLYDAAGLASFRLIQDCFTPRLLSSTLHDHSRASILATALYGECLDESLFAGALPLTFSLPLRLSRRHLKSHCVHHDLGRPALGHMCRPHD